MVMLSLCHLAKVKYKLWYLTGTQGGQSVEVEGSFDNWQHRHALQRSGNDFTLVRLLPPGIYQVSATHSNCALHCKQTAAAAAAAIFIL